MPTTLRSGWTRAHPPSFAVTPNREILVCNGLDRMARWDGVTAAAENAGIKYPNTACSVTRFGTHSVGSITGLYYVYFRYIDDEGIPSNLSPAATISVVGAKTLSYTSILTSGETDRVTAREIWRTLGDTVEVVYLDKTLANNSGTTASSTRTDDELAQQTAMRILNQDGSINANRFTPPPQFLRVLVHCQDRMFLGVDAEYNRGHAVLTNASTAVSGVGVQWRSDFVGRVLYSPVGNRAYTISRYVSASELRISTAFAGTTDVFAPYSIRPPRDEHDALYYSVAGEPESWPNAALRMQEDGDSLTALLPVGPFLYLAKERHTYRLTFELDPAIDGGVYLASDRGCENFRCWARVDGDAFLLDRQGVWKLEGGAARPVSFPVQDLFRTSGGINWQASRWFHAQAFPAENVVRFFVALGSNYLPRQALCYQYRENAWWIEEYHTGLGASAEALIGGVLRQLAGAGAGRVLCHGAGTLDFTTGAPTSRGTVDSATELSLTDSGVSHPSDCVGAPVAILAGKGKGQVRLVVAASGGTLTVDEPWNIQPDTTSVYQVGAIPWRLRTGRMEMPDGEALAKREISIGYTPTTEPTQLDLRTYLDRRSEPEPQRIDLGQTSSVYSQLDDPDVVVNLMDTSGYGSWRMDAPRQERVGPRRFFSLEVRGFQGASPVQVSDLSIEGAG